MTVSLYIFAMDYYGTTFSQYLKGRTEKLILSICSPGSRQKSGGIGTMELSNLTHPTNSMYMHMKLCLGSA